jgi:hypothetical protein
MSENGGRRDLTETLIEGSIGLKHRNLANRGSRGTGRQIRAAPGQPHNVKRRTIELNPEYYCEKVLKGLETMKFSPCHIVAAVTGPIGPYQNCVPRMLRSAISALTRVFDALCLAAWPLIRGPQCS